VGKFNSQLCVRPTHVAMATKNLQEKLGVTSYNQSINQQIFRVA